MPTAVAVGPDGRIYVADGYGASVIHVFGADQKYQKTIGTRGEGEGQRAADGQQRQLALRLCCAVGLACHDLARILPFAQSSFPPAR